MLLTKCIEPTPEPVVVTIERTAATAAELDMIKLAEDIGPCQEELLAVIEESAGPIQDAMWWYKSVDGVRVPYSVTGGALDYYTMLAEQWPVDERNSRVLQWRYRMKYTANVEHYAMFPVSGIVADCSLHDIDNHNRSSGSNGKEVVFQDVFVVTMHLEVNATHNPLWGQFWCKNRSVVISATGSVLGVYGDGPTLVYES